MEEEQKKGNLAMVQINFGPTRKGMIYALRPPERQKLREELGLCGRKQLVVTYVEGEDLEGFHEGAIRWVLPLLLGIRQEEDIRRIERVRLVESYPERLVFEKPMSDIVPHVFKT